jgi:hypothetical protein
VSPDLGCRVIVGPQWWFVAVVVGQIALAYLIWKHDHR